MVSRRRVLLAVTALAFVASAASLGSVSADTPIARACRVSCDASYYEKLNACGRQGALPEQACLDQVVASRPKCEVACLDWLAACRPTCPLEKQFCLNEQVTSATPDTRQCEVKEQICLDKCEDMFHPPKLTITPHPSVEVAVTRPMPVKSCEDECASEYVTDLAECEQNGNHAVCLNAQAKYDECNARCAAPAEVTAPVTPVTPVPSDVSCLLDCSTTQYQCLLQCADRDAGSDCNMACKVSFAQCNAACASSPKNPTVESEVTEPTPVVSPAGDCIARCVNAQSACYSACDPGEWGCLGRCDTAKRLCLYSCPPGPQTQVSGTALPPAPVTAAAVEVDSTLLGEVDAYCLKVCAISFASCYGSEQACNATYSQCKSTCARSTISESMEVEATPVTAVRECVKECKNKGKDAAHKCKHEKFVKRAQCYAQVPATVKACEAGCTQRKPHNGVALAAAASSSVSNRPITPSECIANGC